MDSREKLMRAAKAGEPDVIAGVLDADPSLVDTRDHHGWTMLCHAALAGHSEVVRLLIGRGADVRLNQPIHYAGQRGHQAICRMLIDAGAVDHLVDGDEEAVAAYRALYCYDTRRLKELLGKRPELVRVRQVDGSTMLHEACTNGAMDVVRVLIESGIELDAKNDRGQTALERAVIHNQLDAARLLIEHGAACDVFAAVKCGAANAMARMIDADPSLLKARDAEGRTLLEVAIGIGHREIVRLLLERGIEDHKGLGRQFCKGAVFEDKAMAGTLFRNVNLAGSVFENVNLADSSFHYLNLSNVSIEYANIHGLRIFGVEVAPLVEAELAKKRGG